MKPTDRHRHSRAVMGTLLAAGIWGGSFAAMKFTIQAQLSVGLMLTLRFAIGAACLGILIACLRVPVRKPAVLPGIRMGLLITVIFRPMRMPSSTAGLRTGTRRQA